MRCVSLAVLCLWCSSLALAADMRVVEVEYEDGYYMMVSEVWFDVAREPLFDVFSDWDIATEFSSFVVESRNVGPDENGVLGYYVLNSACIMFFCKSAERNGVVTLDGNDAIYASADPARSDFELSDESWIFADDSDGTLVRYELKMKPGFWVPPFIGPYLIKRKLRSDGGAALDRIEVIAKQRAQQEVADE